SKSRPHERDKWQEFNRSCCFEPSTQLKISGCIPTFHTSQNLLSLRILAVSQHLSKHFQSQ
ncbi:hypothetical protein JD844_011556, partial [Phrynosoma platyrhinos]